MNDSQNSVQGVETNDTDRALARKRIDKRRGLQGAFVAYVVINTFLVGVWAITGGGYFWPAGIIAGWGVGMLLALCDYCRGPAPGARWDDAARQRHGEQRQQPLKAFLPGDFLAQEDIDGPCGREIDHQPRGEAKRSPGVGDALNRAADRLERLLGCRSGTYEAPEPAIAATEAGDVQVAWPPQAQNGAGSPRPPAPPPPPPPERCGLAPPALPRAAPCPSCLGRKRRRVRWRRSGSARSLRT